jgi:dephospho-CoA kinase
MYIRNGYSPQEAMSRISRQMPTPYQMNYADVVIDNSLSLENTAEQVHRALTSVRKNLGETAL